MPLEVELRRELESLCRIRIHRPNGYFLGGGVCISPTGLIATVAHVVYDDVAPNPNIQVLLHNNEDWLAAGFPDYDFALIRLKQPRPVVHVVVPEKLDLEYDAEVISFSNVPVPFAASYGRVSDEASLRTFDYQFGVTGRTAQGTAKLPDPLIKPRGLFIRGGTSGGPIFTKNPPTLIGLCSRGFVPYTVKYLPATLISKAVSEIDAGRGIILNIGNTSNLDVQNTPLSIQDLELGFASSDLVAPQTRSDIRFIAKIVAAFASPSIVSVSVEILKEPVEREARYGCGIIISCERRGSNYLSRIITSASLFTHADPLLPDQIKIDVGLSNGLMCKANLLAYDSHLNLAIITIISESLTSSSIFEALDDCIPLGEYNANPYLLSSDVVSVSRQHLKPFDLLTGFGNLCFRCPKGVDFNEYYDFYEIKNFILPGFDGAPVFSCSGDIIGMMFNNSSFLPSNIISEWLNHYKKTGELGRPYLGLEVVNLYEGDLNFQTQFARRFPEFVMGVVVTKVEKDSPACRSGICVNDIIVKIESKQVGSKMKFYEAVWQSIGKTALDVGVLRVSNGEEMVFSLTMEERSLDKYHVWTHPRGEGEGVNLKSTQRKRKR